MKNSKFQFSNPELVEIVYKINGEFHAKEQLQLKFSSETLVKRAVDVRTAEVVFTLKIFTEDEFKSVPFIAKVSMKGDFQWDQEFDDKVDKLLKINAPATLLSYIRPFIAQFTSFSGFPPLIIPLIDFTQSEDDG